MSQDEIQVLKKAILRLVRDRGPEKTICPSEAARAAYPEMWREKMTLSRQAARELAAQGKITIEQNGTPIDPNNIKGPIRLRIIPV